MKRYTTMLTADQMATAIRAEERRLWDECKGDTPGPDGNYPASTTRWYAVKTLADRLWIEDKEEEVKG